MGFKTWQDAGVVEKLRSLSPTTLVSSRMPPFLFIHGTSDHIVPFEQSTRMCERIRQTGSACDLIPVQGGLHGVRLWEILHKTAYKRQMTDWLRQQLN